MVSKLRLAVGVIEISSGSVSLLIKLSQTNSPVALAIQKYLFYLELLSLSGELTLAIKKGLQKSAKEIIETPESRAQFQELVDDLVAKDEVTKTEADDLVEHLDEVADDAVIGKKKLLKTPKQMWDEFDYKALMEIPPSKKPCFLAGTLVKTENGLLAIEQLAQGDKVVTYNFEKKQTEINSVIKVYQNVTQKYLKIKTKNSIIEATGQHRFWIPKEDKWLMANELKTNMQFLNVHLDLVEILHLEIIENLQKTYNLEIENNHNYFVGKDEILTHNTNKVFKFASETFYDFGFYELVKGKGVDDILYVGITTQPFDIRNSQHAQEGKAALKGTKPYNKWKINVDLLRIKPGYTKMTFYEATVWETYFINERGGGKAHKGLGKLLNRKTPISKKMFEDFKATGKFNPCKYFI